MQPGSTLDGVSYLRRSHWRYLRVYVQQAMQNHAAVFRDGPTLKEGCEKIAALWPELNDLKVRYLRRLLDGLVVCSNCIHLVAAQC